MNGFELETYERIETALKTADTTKKIIIEHKAIAKLPELVIDLFSGQPVLLIADTNTWEAAGEQVLEILKSEDIAIINKLIIDDPDLYAEMKYVDQVAEFIQANQGVPISVGSGTLNDLTKLASHRNNRQYISVATAASVDGYTAFGASITDHGFKQTIFCPAPVAVLVDLDVIIDAPVEMNCWGYTDLLAKVPAGADWILADALDVEPIDDVSWSLVQGPLRKLIADPAGIQGKSPQALCFLVEGLIMSGLAMQKSNSSRPASGAEHQFSHLWDNQHHRFNGEPVSHGFKVAVGSMASIALYDTILELSTSELTQLMEQSNQTWPSFDAIEKQINENFSDEDERKQVVEQSQAKYIDKDFLIKRNEKLLENWEDLKNKLRSQLINFDEFREMLKLAGAPTKPQDIGIEIERLQKSYDLAQLIRKRYTILDVAKETGTFSQCVSRIFAENWFKEIQ